MKFLIVGAGGHAKVVLEVLRTLGREVVGLIDPDPPAAQILGAKVLGGDEILPRLRTAGVEAAVVALGGNRLRETIGRRLVELGFALPSTVHPTAFVSPSATVGDGVVVMPHAVVGTETRIGALAIVNTGAVIDHDNEIGDAAHVAPGCALAGSVRLGARAFLGIGSAVRPGIVIGADTVVGAGSAVVSDIPDGAIVAGVPARPLRRGSTSPVVQPAKVGNTPPT